jgi:hypothetical protein
MELRGRLARRNRNEEETAVPIFPLEVDEDYLAPQPLSLENKYLTAPLLRSLTSDGTP